MNEIILDGIGRKQFIKVRSSKIYKQLAFKNYFLLIGYFFIFYHFLPHNKYKLRTNAFLFILIR